jgi:imidazolonepropionase-like amidohydrolase
LLRVKGHGAFTADYVQYSTGEINNDLLGVADKVGTLRAGKLADIVAVAGNPLTDLKTTEHPIFVMKEGVIYVGAPSMH